MKVGSCCWLLGLERSWWMLLPVRVPGLGPSPVRCRPSPAGAWVKGHEAIAQATGRSFRTARSRLRARTLVGSNQVDKAKENSNRTIDTKDQVRNYVTATLATKDR